MSADTAKFRFLFDVQVYTQPSIHMASLIVERNQVGYR